MGIVDQSGGRVSQAESLAADAGAQIKTHSSHGCFNLGLGTPARYRDNRKHRLTLYSAAAGHSVLLRVRLLRMYVSVCPVYLRIIRFSIHACTRCCAYCTCVSPSYTFVSVVSLGVLGVQGGRGGWVGGGVMAV